MNTTDDGGPAFPLFGDYLNSENDLVVLDFRGMTLRDYFAGQALAGLMTSYADSGASEDVLIKSTARIVYNISDAMLKERDK